MNNLKYTNYEIVFQEVPNETSLAFNISGCTHRCPDCHSKYLWNDVGFPLLNNLQDILNQYKDYITCVCFMGGDQNLIELRKLLLICKKNKLKTCVYSGDNTPTAFAFMWDLLDYLKIGEYIKERGGLNCSTTNQKFFKVHTNNELSWIEDQTYLFQKHYI